MGEADFIREVFDRIDAALDRPLPNGTRRKVERELRATWAGERIYIAGQDMAVARVFKGKRDHCICRDRASGDSLAVIARRYGISRQRVHEIVIAGRGAT